MADKETTELLERVTNKLTEVNDALSKKAEEALAGVKNTGTMTEAVKAEVDKMLTTQNSLKGTVDELKAKLDEVAQAGNRRGGGAERAKSAGYQVIDNEKLKPFASTIGVGQSMAFPVNATPTTTSDVPAGVIEPTRLPAIDSYPKQRLFIRDLIAPGRTTSNAIFWVQMTGFTNAAATVAETTQKPYSDIAFATKTTPVVTLAHMFKASKQILDDFAQLQSTIDVEMRYGLKSVEENEILFGPGTGGRLEGIIPQASDFAPAFEPENRQNIDDIRLAMLQAQLARLPPDGIVIHMTDWAKIELTKDLNGNYILANPRQLSGPTLWGLPVVATDIPAFEGDFLVGAFQTGAQLFDREEANVVIATTNVDDFEKNMISIRCEERLALAVKRPEAFISGTFGTAVTP